MRIKVLADKNNQPEKPIRVLQIIGVLGSGGVEAVILNYYRHIDRSKVQFDFVVHQNPWEVYAQEIKKLGGTVYEVTPYTKNVFKFTYEIYKIIKDGKYDIVHSNMNALSVFPLFAAYLAGAKVRILHNHTTDNKEERLRTILKRTLRPFAKVFANRYFACSKLAGEWMYGKSAVEDGKVKIINNAIEPERFAFDAEKRAELRKELGLENAFVVGHVGRMAPQKNQVYLLDVFSKILKVRENAILLLVGDGPDRKDVEQKIKTLNLEKRVKFLGVRSDVADLYNVMDVFLLPSLYEGLPVVGVEVQANGLPFICSDDVSKEIVLTENIELLALNKGAKFWAEHSLQGERKDLQGSLLVEKYDIRREAKRLEEWYGEEK